MIYDEIRLMSQKIRRVMNTGRVSNKNTCRLLISRIAAYLVNNKISNGISDGYGNILGRSLLTSNIQTEG
jgi:hypothetical protein